MTVDKDILLAAAVEMTKSSGTEYDSDDVASHAAYAMEIQKNWLLLRKLRAGYGKLTAEQIVEFMKSPTFAQGDAEGSLFTT
jgi:hypothetical protein